MTSRYVILTPFDKAEVVAAVLRLREISADVVPTRSGVCVVQELAQKTYDDWDISEILGAPEGSNTDLDANAADTADTADANSPEEVASVLSKLSKWGVVLLKAEVGEDVGLESGTSGLVSAVRVLNGKRGDEIPAGLLINTLDPLVEALILQGVAAGRNGVIRSSEMTPGVLNRLFGRKKTDEQEKEAQ